MKEFNGFLYVVGEFNADLITTTLYSAIAKIDTSGNLYQLNWGNYGGNEGFNGIVSCL
jgi:hypothetical protein